MNTNDLLRPSFEYKHEVNFSQRILAILSKDKSQGTIYAKKSNRENFLLIMLLCDNAYTIHFKTDTNIIIPLEKIYQNILIEEENITVFVLKSVYILVSKLDN